VIDRDELERLLHDVARDRAGAPMPPPDDVVLGHLRSRGQARRRRRSRQVVTLAAAALVGVLLVLVRLTPGGPDPGRVDAVDEPSTTATTSGSTSTTSTSTTSTSTTTPPTSPTSSAASPESDGSDGSGGSASLGPASGMPASTYVGLDVTAAGSDGTGLATSDGRPLGYLTVRGDQPGPGGRTIVQLVDTGHTMVWLLGAGWPAGSTVLDAVDAPWTASVELGARCTAGSNGLVVALVDADPNAGPDAVMAAWTIAADGASLEPIPPTTPVTCTG
jgi:hypothetical protein